MAHIAKSVDNSKLRMTKDKEMNLLARIPIPYYFLAIRLSKDKRYWDNKQIKYRWAKYFNAEKMEEVNADNGISYYFRPQVMINIISEIGLVNKDNQDQCGKAIEIFNDLVNAELDKTFEIKARLQAKQWVKTITQHPELAQSIVEAENDRIKKLKAKIEGGVRK